MKSLEFLSQVPAVRRDNFNRASSACRSRAGYVIHSGVHRSTAFVSDLDAVSSLEFWKALSQSALNGWIEATVSGETLADCEHTAIARHFPAYSFHRVRGTGKNTGAGFVIASCVTRGLDYRTGAGSWQALANKLS
jgi:hypothetical protein